MNISGILERPDMAGQIPICYLDEFFEFIKIRTVIDDEGAHDSKPYPAVKNFIQLLNGILHDLIGFKPPHIFWASAEPVIFPPHSEPIQNMKSAKSKGPEDNTLSWIPEIDNPKNNLTVS